MSQLHSALILSTHEDEGMTLKYALPTCGIAPKVTNNIQDAIQELSSEASYDFVYVDMHLANHSAFMFLQLLSQHKNHALRALPVIGLIGRVNQSELSGLAELGVFNLISKPLTERSISEKSLKIIDEYENPNSSSSLDLNLRKAMIKGEHARALALAKSALDKNPKSVRLHVSLAVAHYNAHQDDMSSQILNKLLPNLADSLYLPYVLTILAKLHIRKKEPTAALQFLEKAQAICPHNMERLLLISELLLSINKAAVAEQKFRTAMRFFPNSVSARIGLGKALVAQGDIDGAQKVIQNTSTGKAKMLSHLNHLGVELSKHGKFAEAIRTYETALQMAETSKDLSSIWYNIALAWSKAGGFGKASAACTKSIQAEPSNEKAKTLLMRCGTELTKPATFGEKLTPEKIAAKSSESEIVKGGISAVSADLIDRIEKGILEDAMG